VKFEGLYINLPTSTDRDARMREQLAALGIAQSYRRFEAIRGAKAAQRGQTTLPDGHLGCWLSHQAAWVEGRESGRHLHVLEDDAILGDQLAAALKSLEPEDDGWDLIFTDVYFHPPPTPEQFARLRLWKQAFSDQRKITLADLKALPFTGTTSYLVNHRSIDKLLSLTDGKWTLNRTFDVHLQHLVGTGQIRAQVTIPFLSTLAADNIDSTTGAQGPALAALNAFREALYCKADADAIYARIRPCDDGLGTEPLLGIYLELLRNVLGRLNAEKP